MNNYENHLGAIRPQTDSTDLEAPVAWGIDYPSWTPDEILPGLFMGGTHDDRTVADPMPLHGLGRGTEFDAVVTLYAWAQPVDWEVEELRYGFGDGALHGSDLHRVIRAAQWAHDRWQAGDRGPGPVPGRAQPLRAGHRAGPAAGRLGARGARGCHPAHPRPALAARPVQPPLRALAGD